MLGYVFVGVISIQNLANDQEMSKKFHKITEKQQGERDNFQIKSFKSQNVGVN